MGKFKNVVFRYLMLFACIGLMVSISNCTSDDDDDVKIETFLEKHDGTKWKVTEDDEVVYMRINDNMDKPIEVWANELDLDKGLADDDCYYYIDNLLVMEELKIVENTSDKLTLSYNDTETWSFIVEDDRLKMQLIMSNDLEETIYMDKTTDDVDSFEICSEDFMFIFGR